MSTESSLTGSDYLDCLLAEGKVAAPTAGFDDYVVPPSTEEWDGQDTAEIVSDLRDERIGC
jgi:hypothetical protein